MWIRTSPPDVTSVRPSANKCLARRRASEHGRRCQDCKASSDRNGPRDRGAVVGRKIRSRRRGAGRPTRGSDDSASTSRSPSRNTDSARPSKCGRRTWRSSARAVGDPVHGRTSGTSAPGAAGTIAATTAGFERAECRGDVIERAHPDVHPSHRPYRLAQTSPTRQRRARRALIGTIELENDEEARRPRSRDRRGRRSEPQEAEGEKDALNDERRSRRRGPWGRRSWGAAKPRPLRTRRDRRAAGSASRGRRRTPRGPAHRRWRRGNRRVGVVSPLGAAPVIDRQRHDEVASRCPLTWSPPPFSVSAPRNNRRRR